MRKPGAGRKANLSASTIRPGIGDRRRSTAARRSAAIDGGAAASAIGGGRDDAPAAFGVETAS